MLVGIDGAGRRQLVLEARDFGLPRRDRGGVARDRDRLARAARVGVELLLEHRQAILLAAQRRGVRLELLAETAERLQVALHLLRQAAHVRLLGLAQLALEGFQPGFALSELGADEHRRPGGLLGAASRALVHEDGGEPVRDALGAIGLRVGVGHREAVEFAGLGVGHRLGDIDGDVAAQPRDRRRVVGVGRQPLVGDHARQERRAQELLGDGADAFLIVEGRGLAHEGGRHRGRLDRQRRFRRVLFR